MNGSLDLDGVGAGPSERVFQVVVRDGVHEALVPVKVNVTMVNEYTPVMSQASHVLSVPENVTSGYQLVQVN